MYISKLYIKGYKNSAIRSDIALHKGLNVLVGENGCGKTTIINALRLILRESEAYLSFSNDDLYCSLDKSVISKEVEIDADIVDLNPDEKITFLSWCDSEFNAQLHFTISENSLRPGTFKRKYWGGQSSASIFEEDTFDRVECIYLPPLRDAEAKLSNGKRSRLSYLLKKIYGENSKNLVESVNEFNNTITQNVDGKYSEIENIKITINNKIYETLGAHLGQSINLQFSETTFNKIIENIRMVFFPQINETDILKFRDLATNSLGYNNLLYIATVFSELELIKDSNIFTVLLIEEPEAHLHPQLQIKFIKYLESLSKSLKNAQIVVTTHSPVLASSVNIDKIIHISNKDNQINATAIAEKKFGDDLSEKYINRWLDVTKSTMLFSRGIILVEGIAEALVVPHLAKVVLANYNKIAEEKSLKKLANTLDEMGVTVINISGVNFNYFMKLFGNFDESSGVNIPINCAGMTDRDPDKELFPLKKDNPKSTNYLANNIDEINNNDYTRLFMSPLKTFEYDLGIENPVIFANVLKNLWKHTGGDVCKRLDDIIKSGGKYNNEKDLSEDVKYIYKHIENIGKGLFAYTLSENISNDFNIPEYIKNAVLWACGVPLDDQN